MAVAALSNSASLGDHDSSAPTSRSLLSNSSTMPAASSSFLAHAPTLSFPPGTTVQPNAQHFYGTPVPMSMPGLPSAFPAAPPAWSAQHPVYPAGYNCNPQNTYYTQPMRSPPPGPHASKLPSSQQQPNNGYRPSHSHSYSHTGSVQSSALPKGALSPSSQHSRNASHNIGRSRTQSDLQGQRPTLLKHEIAPDSFVAQGHAAPSTHNPVEAAAPAPPFLRSRSDSASSSLSSSVRRSAAFLERSDDDTPLALGARSRVSSKDSSASSPSHTIQQRPSFARSVSDRSVTPTPSATSSAERPRSSLSTTRAATPSGPVRSSPLAQTNDTPVAPSKEKKTGLNKFKKAFGSSNEASHNQQRSHQASNSMNSTISHSSSTSGASTSPPATPPDNASDLVAPPAVYTHSDASMSSTTLQSQLDVHVEPDHSAPPRRKKLSLFNAKMNASTDNISISSTMSSASQVLRKIGTFGGKLSKRSSLASIGSMFHKDKAARDADDAQSEFGVSTTPTSRLRKGLKRPKGHPSAASVSLATAEQEAPPTNGGLTPAAQLAKEQQDRYAEQEAKEKESERAQTASPAPSTEDRRLKLLEKEKNKLNKKSRKLWGKGSFGGNQSVGYSKESAEVATSSSPVDEFGHPTASEEDNESLTRHDDYASLHTQSLPMPAVSGSLFEETLSSLEDRTPRQSTDASAVASTSGSALRSVFEDDTNSLTQPFHAAPSTNSVNESGSEYESSLYRGYQPGREPTPPMPSKAAPRPLRGILKPSRAAGSFNASDKVVRPSERTRASSTASAAALTDSQNIPPTHLSGHQRHSSLQGLGHFLSADTFDSPLSSPSASIRGPSPYAHPGANRSEPLLSSKGVPSLGPRAVTMPSNKRLNFATNLSVHTTWPAAVYDRRGEAATCSRLTPALAQRIKDELNNYKLQEMDVHQQSRIYTHFFS